MFSKEIQHSMISNFFHSTIFTNDDNAKYWNKRAIEISGTKETISFPTSVVFNKDNIFISGNISQ